MKLTFKSNIDEVSTEVKNWIMTRMTIEAEYRDYSEEEVEKKKIELKARGIELFVEEDSDKKYVVNMGCRYVESKEIIILYELTFDIDIKEKVITYKYNMVI